jgi:hypothetical protein
MPLTHAELNGILKVLSPQSMKLYKHMVRCGHVTALQAMVDYGITSATLARRICDMEEAGIPIKRVRRKHKITGKQYTRYQLDWTRMPKVSRNVA